MRSFFKKIYGNEFLRGGALLTTTSFLANILNYLFNLIAARSLGPAGYGELATFFSYSVIISVPLTVVSTILIQKISTSGQNRFSKVHQYELFFIQKIKKWWPFTIFFLILTPLVPNITNLGIVTAYSLVPFMFLSFPTTFYTAALQGLKLFTFFSLLNLFATFIKLLGALLVMIGVDGLSTILFFLFLSGLFILYTGHRVLARKISAEEKKGGNVDKHLRSILKDRQFIITTLSILAITLFNNIDIVFVKKYFSATDAGIYASWSLFAKIILYAIAPLISVSFVFFSGETNKINERKALIISLAGLFFVGIVSFFAYTYFSNALVSMLFGNRYDSVIPYLSKASIFGSFYTAIFFINNYFLAKKRIESILLAFAIILYIILLFVFGKSLIIVINVNILFSTTVLILFILLLLAKKEVV